MSETNVASNKFANLGRPNSGGGARPRLRTGYHSAVIKTDMKVNSGTRSDGSEWANVSCKLDITGPSFSDATKIQTVTDQFSMFMPDPFRLDDKGAVKKTRNGQLQSNLGNLTTLLAALGGPMATEENPLAYLEGVDGLVEPADVDIDGWNAIGDDEAAYIEWVNSNWPVITSYFVDMFVALGKPGVAVVAKYLSGDGTSNFIEKNGRKEYDNAEVVELLGMARFEKLKDQIPSTDFDRTKYQRLMAKQTVANNSASPGAAGGSSGQKPTMGKPAPRPAGGAFKRPGSKA